MQSSEILFQYITCYSLSKKKLSKCETTSCFNTSHVTLYLDVPPEWLGEQFLFQYITCYSLSRHGWSWNPYPGVSIHHMLLFIPRFIGILSIHMSNNTPKPKEFQYFYQALLEILYF